MKYTKSVLAYMIGDMRRHPLLTKTQEANLVEAMLAGDTSARDKLVCANMRIAMKIAREFECSGVPIEDLTSAAMCGLVRAIDKYTPGKSKLTYFVGIFVRGELIRITSAERCLVKVGTTVAQQKCVYKLGADDDVAEASERIGVPAATVAEMKIRLQGEVRLDDRFGESNTERMVDTLVADCDTPEEKAEKSEMVRMVGAALRDANISSLQRQIVEEHIMDDKPIHQLVRELKMPKKLIECELAEALLKLRNLLQAK